MAEREIDQLLASLPDLVRRRDTAGLKQLEDHRDKRVRKAVRKALHDLRSRGIEVPDEVGPRSWAASGLRALRGRLDAAAMIDTRGAPGATRFMLSEPEQDEGARLFVGLLAPDDRIVDFAAYFQTDGQRARMIRDWERESSGRTVPVDWLKARVRFARENTVHSGQTCPAALDQNLSVFDVPFDRRPVSFVASELRQQAAWNAEAVDEVLAAAGAHLWPPMIDLDAAVRRFAESAGEPAPDDDTRNKTLAKVVENDELVRRGLVGRIANALEDSAVTLWLEGRGADARGALEMAQALRDSPTPEQLPWAPRIIAFQLASFARTSLARDHEHHHDHDHDHDHHHDHDHEHHHHHHDHDHHHDHGHD